MILILMLSFLFISSSLPPSPATYTHIQVRTIILQSEKVFSLEFTLFDKPKIRVVPQNHRILEKRAGNGSAWKLPFIFLSYPSPPLRQQMHIQLQFSL